MFLYRTWYTKYKYIALYNNNINLRTHTKFLRVQWSKLAYDDYEG